MKMYNYEYLQCLCIGTAYRKGGGMMAQNDLKVVVATHKPYAIPQDEVFLPVQAGAALHDSLPYQSDDEGESISRLNGNWCELTVLYWAWKNLPADYLGLMHYRRYLGRGRQAAGREQLMRELEKAPVLLPKKRNYWIESNQSQYVHAHGEDSLLALKAVMEERCPEYLPAFERSLRRTSGHRFNIFVMRRDLADAYCQWLFGLLFALEERIAGTETEIPRLYGFLSERMLDCWLEKNQLAYREMPVYNTEPQHWGKKIYHFLKRKLTYTADKAEKETPV